MECRSARMKSCGRFFPKRSLYPRSDLQNMVLFYSLYVENTSLPFKHVFLKIGPHFSSPIDIF